MSIADVLLQRGICVCNRVASATPINCRKRSTFEDVDRYADPIVREPVAETIDVVVLGGVGFGGLCASAYPTMQDVTNFRIVEEGGDFGGTWHWNRYQGVQCDVESMIYMPLLEEAGYIPNQRYSDGDEIVEHAQRIGRHFDLYRTCCFRPR